MITLTIHFSRDVTVYSYPVSKKVRHIVCFNSRQIFALNTVTAFHFSYKRTHRTNDRTTETAIITKGQMHCSSGFESRYQNDAIRTVSLLLMTEEEEDLGSVVTKIVPICSVHHQIWGPCVFFYNRLVSTQGRN